MSDIDTQIKEVNTSLKSVGDQLKAFAEKSEKEIKAHAAVSEQTKQSVDKLLIEQGELQARLRTAEQALAKMEDGHGQPSAAMTAGQIFANNEAVKAFKGGKVMIDINAAAQSGAITRQSDNTAGTSIVAPHYVDGIRGPGQRRLTIRDLLSWGTTQSDSVQFVRENGYTNAAAPVGENPSDPKPKSELKFELDTAPVVTIAHWLPASRQVLRDVGQMQSYVDGRLRYGLDIKEEQQLLLGSGVGGNISGVYTQATAYSLPSGAYVANETSIDRLRLAILQAELADYSVDGIVISSTDWANIELLKDGDKRHLFGNPASSVASVLWGRTVVATPAMTAGKFLVGNFAMGAQGWDREQYRIAVADQHGEFFTHNMVAILAEKDIALTVYRPDAFVKGDLIASAST